MNNLNLILKNLFLFSNFKFRVRNYLIIKNLIKIFLFPIFLILNKEQIKLDFNKSNNYRELLIKK